MNRISILIFTVLLSALLLTGCASNQLASIDESNSETSPSPITIVRYTCYERYDHLSDYISRLVDSIIVGTITQPPSVTRINVIKLGYVSGSEETWSNVTSYQIRVDDVLKGNKKKGETITVDQYGGTYEGITEYIEGFPYLEQNKTLSAVSF